MPFNMSVFTGKPLEYKGGVILLVIGTLLYIIAFSSPFWVKARPDEEHHVEGEYTGLWQQCVYSSIDPMTCYSVHPLMFVGYFHSGAIAVQALQCVGLVGLILATWNEVQTNFFDGGLPCRYFTEVTGGLGSLTGFTGAMVFVYGMQNVVLSDRVEYSWCLPLDILGCLSCALSTFLTFKFKGYDDTRSQNTQVMPFNMSVFTGKPREYKGGVILLVIGTLLYIIAFSAPFWVMRAAEHAVQGECTGLWQTCDYNPVQPMTCYSVQPRMFAGYFHSGAIAVQALQCVGLVGLILATWNEVQTNFFDGGLPCRYFTEVTGGLGSLAGFTGAMVFVYGMENKLPTGRFEYSWCLPLDILGCLSCALSTFLTFNFKGYDDTTYSVLTALQPHDTDCEMIE